MFERLRSLLRGRVGTDARRRRNLQLPNLHLPDLHLRELRWDDIAAIAQGRKRERELRGGVVLPTMLTLAGAGATLFWWRQWAQGRAESEAATSTSMAPDLAATGVCSVPATDPIALEANLAVLGAAQDTLPSSSSRRA